jgi:hypothetical protein
MHRVLDGGAYGGAYGTTSAEPHRRDGAIIAEFRGRSRSLANREEI